MTDGDVVVTGKELAAYIGCKPSYVVELKRNGRLVLAPDGKGYLKSASLALYEETRDPSRAGVAERHAAARGAQLVNVRGDGDADPVEDDEGDAEPKSSDAKRKAKALADKAETDAHMAQIELSEKLGELLPRDEVERAVGEAATGLRIALERIPDTLAPQLAAITDEAKVRQLLWDELTHALEELSRGFRSAAKLTESQA
ncbi:hypothetical protein NB688_000570 [Xanthomonas sacchari]|uniref:Terminase small subunit n=1 Tax=Xanthomonas sacchari TaxID=56458 RepID=A0ABT3DTD4_9XANT|nr:DUF1441 family protein [Xanthomonas sacchari]MCW0398756.1 hypothetical protein [Xanthomonas sacchari]MCW0418404.1 hypothetical protein [Xanthomonas sacchari]UYK72533.1 DUF1441 family protein [Xanthomonas sacchari]